MSEGKEPALKESIYARPRLVKDISKCHFYHTIDLPEYGLCKGEWDLREKVDEYLGGVDFYDKRVLDVGTASGFLCFHAESMGAEVVSFDSSEDYIGDIIPFARSDMEKAVLNYKKFIRRLNNSYWLAHRAYGSESKVVYGTVYNVPEAIGAVDISILGAIIEHLRDPFLALQNALKLTKETVIIVELLRGVNNPPYMQFLPVFNSGLYNMSWWYLTPEVVQQFIGVLGFEESRITIHYQRSETSAHDVCFYTVVGHRTRGVVN